MTENQQSKFKSVMDALGKQAFENNNLSYEELQILQQVAYDITEYEDALKRALRDGIITTKENKMLTYLKDQINSNAIKVANLDQVVDSEEEGMLKCLCEVLDKYL